MSARRFSASTLPLVFIVAISVAAPPSAAVRSTPVPAAAPRAERELTPVIWREMPPPDLWPTCGVYDPPGDRLVIFGRSWPELRNEVWALSLSHPDIWRQLDPAGDPPAARDGASAVYDPVGKRMIVFGGYGKQGFLNDTWALALSGEPTWARLPTTGTAPGGRYNHSAVIDLDSQRMIVFGGALGGNIYSPQLNDAWALALSGNREWSRLQPIGDPPPARSGHVAVYDGRRHSMLVLQGYGGGRDLFDDVWELSLRNAPRWNQVPISGPRPPATAWTSWAYDEAAGKVVLPGIGGQVSSWSLSLDPEPRWTEWSVRGDAPLNHFGTAVVDARRGRLVLYSTIPDVWALSLGNDPAWTELPHRHASAGHRYWHSALYDSIRQRMVVFGGDRGIRQSDELSPSGETWTYALRGTPGPAALCLCGEPCVRAEAPCQAAEERGRAALPGELLQLVVADRAGEGQI